MATGAVQLNTDNSNSNVADLGPVSARETRRVNRSQNEDCQVSLVGKHADFLTQVLNQNPDEYCEVIEPEDNHPMFIEPEELTDEYKKAPLRTLGSIADTTIKRKQKLLEEAENSKAIPDHSSDTTIAHDGSFSEIDGEDILALRQRLLPDDDSNIKPQFRLVEQTPSYKVIEILLPSFSVNTAGNPDHFVRGLLHVPLIGSPPEDGWPIVPYILGSAFVHENMSQTPHRGEMAELCSQYGMALLTLEYCVKDRFYELLASEEKLATHDDGQIKVNDQIFGTDEPFFADAIANHTRENGLTHISLDVEAFLTQFKKFESISIDNETIPVQIISDHLIATSSGAGIASTLSTWRNANDQPTNLTIINGAICFSFPDILTRQLVGEKDLKKVNNDAVLPGLTFYDPNSLPEDVFDLRMENDGVINRFDHLRFLTGQYLAGNQTPDDSLTSVTIYEDKAKGVGHNSTNFTGKPMSTINATAFAHFVTTNNLQNYALAFNSEFYPNTTTQTLTEEAFQNTPTNTVIADTNEVTYEF